MHRNVTIRFIESVVIASICTNAVMLSMKTDMLVTWTDASFIVAQRPATSLLWSYALLSASKFNDVSIAKLKLTAV